MPGNSGQAYFPLIEGEAGKRQRPNLPERPAWIKGRRGVWAEIVRIRAASAKRIVLLERVAESWGGKSEPELRLCTKPEPGDYRTDKFHMPSGM